MKEIEWGLEENTLLQGNTIVLGDCMEVLKDGGLADNSIDAIITDLPYARTRNKWDILIPLEDYILEENKQYTKDQYFITAYRKGTPYNIALIDWNSNHNKGLWFYYNKVIKDNGVIVLFCDGMFMADIMKSNEKLWRYNLVWNKELTSGFLNANRQPLRQHEEMVIFYKKQPMYVPQKTKGKPNHSKGFSKKNTNNNYGEFDIVDNKEELGDMKHPTSIWQFQKPHPSKMVHPTEKPVSLIVELLRTFTTEGDIVLDNTMGSGSTGVACREENRQFIGIEKERDYFNIAKERLKGEM